MCSWPQRPIGELFEIARRTVAPFAFPAERFHHYSIPAWDSFRGPQIEPGSAIGSTKLLIEQPTLLVSKLNPRISRVVLIEHVSDARYCASTEFIPYTPKDPDASLRFFNWLFQSRAFQSRLEQTATGSTNSHTRARPHETLRWLVGCPPPKMQSAIATVLDTLATTIEQSAAVVAKLKQIRLGLLQAFLAYGIDEKGQIRNPLAHPEQFQDSLVGRIPKGWTVSGILDLATSDRPAVLTGPFGAQLGQLDFVAAGVPVLRIGNVQAGFLDVSDIQHVTREKARELARYRVLPGDLLFARQGATTGRNALAEHHVEGWLFNYHIIRVAIDQKLCNPAVLHAIFNSGPVQRQINRDKGRGTREGINTAQIINLRFAVPAHAEQQRMVAVLEAHARELEIESRCLSKLVNLRLGIVEDLLSGRIRLPESILASEAHA